MPAYEGQPFDPPAPKAPKRWRFRLIHLIYAVTLWGAAIGTLGVGGILLAILVLAAWSYVFARESRGRALRDVSVLGLLSMCCWCGVILPSSTGREASRRMGCGNNMKQIALALHNYHDTYKTLPAAYIADENGVPMHSWRVLILPFVEEQALYAAYRFDEPWNGPNNSKLAAQRPYVFRCPSHQPLANCTSYVAVVGKKTMWPGRDGIRFQDVSDGTSNAILVMECNALNLNWMEPRDLDYDEALKALTSQDFSRRLHFYEDFFYRKISGRNVALADTSVQFVPGGQTVRTASALLQRNDGTVVYLDSLEATHDRQLRVDNCVRLAVLIFVILLPLPWLWIKPKRRQHG